MSSPAEDADALRAANMRLVRLTLYTHRGMAQLAANCSPSPYLGLHAGFGATETVRLQGAMQRHGRADRFDELAVPVDVLLRTLSFIPNPTDPRVRARTMAGDPLPVKALWRAAATSSTLLYTIMENKCILGAKAPPAVCVRAAKAAQLEMRTRSTAKPHGRFPNPRAPEDHDEEHSGTPTRIRAPPRPPPPSSPPGPPPSDAALAQLFEMGFPDTLLVRAAQRGAGNDVAAAVNRLLG